MDNIIPHTVADDVASLKTADGSLRLESSGPLAKGAYERSASMWPDTGDYEGTLLAEAISLPVVSLSMPQSTYGAVILLPLLWRSETSLEWFFSVGETYLRLAVNYVLQGIFLYHLFTMWCWNHANVVQQCGEEDGDVWWIYPTLWFACMWIFVASVLRDLAETMVMAEIVACHIPTVEVTDYLRYKRNTEDEVGLVSGGMSQFRKMMTFIFVIVPKAVIGLGLIVFGGGYLADTTTNTDFMLNALAVLFILDMDELVYEVFTPARQRRLMEAVPAFEAGVGGSVQETLEKYGTVTLNMLVSLMIILVFWLSLASSRCTHKWDTGSGSVWSPEWVTR